MMPGFQWGMGWMGLLPLLWIGLIVALIYFIVQSGKRASKGYRPSGFGKGRPLHCLACGADVETDWKVCPYCETPLHTT